MSAEMVAVKISKLEGRALDHAVAQARGLPTTGRIPHYSKTWALVGPLIDELRLTFASFGTGPAINGRPHIYPIVCIPANSKSSYYVAAEGPTHLIAACRSYVFAKMTMDKDGEVMVPASLVTQ